MSSHSFNGNQKHIHNVALEERLQFHGCLRKSGKSAVSKSGCTSQTGENRAEPSVMEPTAKPKLALPVIFCMWLKQHLPPGHRA